MTASSVLDIAILANEAFELCISGGNLDRRLTHPGGGSSCRSVSSRNSIDIDIHLHVREVEVAPYSLVCASVSSSRSISNTQAVRYKKEMHILSHPILASATHRIHIARNKTKEMSGSTGTGKFMFVVSLGLRGCCTHTTAQQLQN